MAGLVHELLEVLRQQKECYQDLLTLAKYKTDSLVERNMELLEEVLKREQEFIGRAARLEKDREALLKDISTVLNTNPKSLTISTLITKLEKTPKEQKELSQIREELLEIATGLKSQNVTNEALLRQSIDFIEFTLNAIQSANSYSSNGYQNQGDEIKEQNVRFFDQKQ